MKSVDQHPAALLDGIGRFGPVGPVDGSGARMNSNSHPYPLGFGDSFLALDLSGGRQ